VAIYVIVHSVQSPEQLELLLNRVEAHPGQLSFEDTREMARLYRFCSARLAVQRSRGRDLDAIRYLNALCVRAYTRLQVPTIARQRLPDFVFADFPKVLAATAWLQAVVAIVTLAGAVAGASVVSQNPAALYDCIPSSMYPSGQLDTLMESHEARAEFLERKPVDFGWKSDFFGGALHAQSERWDARVCRRNPGGDSYVDTGFLQRFGARGFCVALFARFFVADVLGVDVAACDSGATRRHALFHRRTYAGESRRGTWAANSVRGAPSRGPSLAGDGCGFSAVVHSRGLYREFRSSIDALDARQICRRRNCAWIDRRIC
jgi:hypothetical protein